MTPEHKAAIAEGKRKAKEARMAAAVIETPVPQSGPAIVQVTYRPFDGDPHTTVWNGITFHANVPVELDRNNRAYYYEIPEGIYVVNPSTGRRQLNHTEVFKFMGDIALGNPSFEVDGERAKKLINKRILPQAGHGWAEDHADEIVEFR